MSGGNGEPPGRVVVRAATSADAARVAELHVTAINEGFLATLGPRFLRRLYSRIVASSHGFLIVACDPGPGPVIGSSAGATSVRRLYVEFLLRDGLIAAVTSAPRLVRSIPGSSKPCATERRTSRALPRRTPGSRKDQRRSCSSLAVATTARRRGAGAELVRSFQSKRRRRARRRPRRGGRGDERWRHPALCRSGFVEADRFELHPGTESLLLRVRPLELCPP